MNKELIAQMGDQYPKMFLFQALQPSEHVDFSCGEGWYNILNAMFLRINSYIEDHNDRCVRLEDAQQLIIYGQKDDVPSYLVAQIEEINTGNAEFPIEMLYPKVRQIKEKFGTLRVYLDITDSNIDEIVWFAETMSETTCEECGNIGELRRGSWLKTLCETHADRRDENLKIRSTDE